MLTITRKHGERVTVHTPGGDVVITVKDSTGHKAKIGIQCRRDWNITRSASSHTSYHMEEGSMPDHDDLLSAYMRKRAMRAMQEVIYGPSPEYDAQVLAAYEALSLEDKQRIAETDRDLAVAYAQAKGEEDVRVSPSRVLLQYLPLHRIQREEMAVLSNSVAPFLAPHGIEFYEAVHMMLAHGYVEYTCAGATYQITAAGVAARDVDKGTT